MIVRPADLSAARAAIRDGGTPGAGLTLAMIAPEGFRRSTIVDLAGIADLRGIVLDGKRLRIGALTTIEALRASPLVQNAAPSLVSVAAAIGSLQLRNLATIGGNVAWWSGDLVPVLLAHGARMVVDGAEIPLARPEPGMLVEAILLPMAGPSWSFAEKVGRRSTFSPTIVTVCATADLAAGRMARVTLALGGGGERPRRLPQAEARLVETGLEALDGPEFRRSLREEIGLGAQPDDAEAPLRARIAANLLCARLAEATSATTTEAMR